jgi:hypothetical protein
MIERRRAPTRVDITNRGDCFISGFAGNEPRRKLLEKTKTGRKILETFLPRKVDQRAASEHVR